MCEQFFEDENGNLVTKYEYIRMYVLDTEGCKQKVKCPKCEKEANRHDFDELICGSINSYYSINCPHCGYHECDQEYCSICESSVDVDDDIDELEMAINAGGIVDNLFHAVLDDVKNDGLANPVVWSMAKSVIYKNSDAIQFCDVDGVSIFHKPSECIAVLKKHLLDAKFNRNLELKIAQAKEE